MAPISDDYNADVPLNEMCAEDFTDAVVLVDPYSSGRQLLQAFIENGTFVIAVQSTADFDPLWLVQFEPENYHRSISHRTLSETVDFIKQQGVPVRACLPASEMGVLLAEQIQQHMGLPTNVGDPEIRRHKNKMHTELKKHGVRGISEIVTSCPVEATKWINENTTYPIIIKPPMGGGSEGLHICSCDADVEKAFHAEMSQRNITGVVNTEMLVQELINGTEYVVDCISHEGRHLCVAMWKYSKVKNTITGRITYEYSEFLEYDGPEQAELRQYVYQCLDALGLQNGGSHSEVIIDANGPCLIETGARMHGGQGPHGTKLATGIAPYTLLVDIAVNGGKLHEKLYNQKGYNLQGSLLYVDLANFKYRGKLARSIEEQFKQNNITTLEYIHCVQPGEDIVITEDLVTTPGCLLMIHSDRNVVFRDYNEIRRLENEGLYEIVVPAA